MAKIAIEKAKSRALSFEEAISLTGFGRFNLFVILANGGCLMCVIMETMGMMYVNPAATCDLELTLPMRGYLSSASFLGVVSGSHFWGFLADTRGRKKCVLVSMLTSFIVTIISSFISQGWLFILLRYFNGLFVGGASGIVYAYAGEFHNNIYRPKVVTWISGFVGVGSTVLPALAWIVLPAQWSIEIPSLGIIFTPWRLLVIIYGLPSLFFTMCIFVLPESPKYLLTLGKQDEALAILKNVYAKNSGKSPDEFPVTEILWDEKAVNNDNKQGFFKTIWLQTAPLIRKPLAAKTFIVCFLQFGAFVSTSGLSMWLPEVLNKMSVFEKENPGKKVGVCAAIQYQSINELSSVNATNNTTPECTISENVFIIGILVGTFLMVMYIIVGSLINVLGKKWLLVSLFTISSVTALTTQFVYEHNAIQILMGLSLTASTTIGVITAVVVDLYPTHVRAMAIAISLMFGRVGAFTGAYITGLLFNLLCDYTFVIFTLDNLILILLVFVLLTTKKASKMITPVA